MIHTSSPVGSFNGICLKVSQYLFPAQEKKGVNYR